MAAPMPREAPVTSATRWLSARSRARSRRSSTITLPSPSMTVLPFWFTAFTSTLRAPAPSDLCVTRSVRSMVSPANTAAGQRKLCRVHSAPGPGSCMPMSVET